LVSLPHTFGLNWFFPLARAFLLHFPVIEGDFHYFRPLLTLHKPPLRLCLRVPASKVHAHIRSVCNSLLLPHRSVFIRALPHYGADFTEFFTATKVFAPSSLESFNNPFLLHFSEMVGFCDRLLPFLLSGSSSKRNLA